MIDEKALSILSKQLENTAERIGSIADGIAQLREMQSDIVGTYENFLMDEVTHVQILALEMTRLIAGEEGGNADDSAFGPGELNSVIGEKEDSSSNQ